MSIETMFEITQIEKRDVEEYWTQVELISNHPVYQGHFPGYPLTPGVLMIIMARCALGIIEGGAIMWSYIKKCRYYNKVFPGEVLTLKLFIARRQDGKNVVNVFISRSNVESTPVFSMEAFYNVNKC